MANRQGRNIDKSSGNYTHDNNSSGRQWVNGEDTRQNKTYKRNHNEKGRRGFYNNDQEDDRTFNVKSMSSMTTASQGNSARKMAETEESKDRWKNESSSFQNKRVKEGWPEEEGKTFLLGEDPDEEKFMLDHSWSSDTRQPFELKNISQFGLDLNDNR